MKKIVKHIGEIGVDAGLCWIGDPCYILHKEVPPKAIGKDWGEFYDILHKDHQYPTAKQFNYDLGHPGLGVVLSTGYGGGVYPVFAQFGDEGRIAKAWVEFMAEDDMSGETVDTHSGPPLSSPHNLNLPWSLHFDRAGAEDIATIRDAQGHNLVTSGYFRLPEDDGPAPPTLAAMQLMAAAPDLLTFVSTIARMTNDGEEIEGREFVMENDDAVATLNQLIDSARHLLADAAGRAA